MRDRFAWGLTGRDPGPDLPTRIAAVRRLATEHAIPSLDVDVLRQIALAAPENLRRLEGALTRVTAFASLVGETPTSDLVRKALGSPPARPSPGARGRSRRQLDSIKRAVCDVLHLAPADMTSRRARRPQSAAASSRCTWPATTPTSRSPRSPAASPATTRPSSTRSATSSVELEPGSRYPQDARANPRTPPDFPFDGLGEILPPRRLVLPTPAPTPADIASERNPGVLKLFHHSNINSEGQ